MLQWRPAGKQMNAPLVVRARPPLQQRVALIAALAMAAVMIWGVFEWGRKAGGHDAIEAAITRDTRLIHGETIGNPTMPVLDIPAISEIAHRHGIPLMVDSTFATPLGQQPLAHGVDISLHSATKGIAGHNDATLGVVAGEAEAAALADGIMYDPAMLSKDAARPINNITGLNLFLVKKNGIIPAVNKILAFFAICCFQSERARHFPDLLLGMISHRKQ